MILDYDIKYQTVSSLSSPCLGFIENSISNILLLAIIDKIYNNQKDTICVNKKI